MKLLVEVLCDGVSYPPGTNIKALPKRNRKSVVQAGLVQGAETLADIGEKDDPPPVEPEGDAAGSADAVPGGAPIDWSGIPKRVQNVLKKEGVTDRATLTAKRDELGGDLSQIPGVTEATAADLDALLV
ncbi:MAG: hypothetical protein KDA71_05395 [Planctomycetales bacterium]|nr:hypothetical protein [Planctomycetales bacterium]